MKKEEKKLIIRIIRSACGIDNPQDFDLILGKKCAKFIGITSNEYEKFIKELNGVV